MKLLTKVICVKEVQDLNDRETYQVWKKFDAFFEKWKLADDRIKDLDEAEDFAKCPGLSDEQMKYIAVAYQGAFRNGVLLAKNNLDEPATRKKKKAARAPEVAEGFLPSEEKQDDNLNLKL